MPSLNFLHQRFLQHKTRYPIMGLLLQVSGLIGVILNWENQPAYIVWSGLYGLLLVGSFGIIWWLSRNQAAAWQRLKGNFTLKPVGLLPILIGYVVLWSLPLTPEYPFNALRWLLTTSGIFLAAALIETPIPESIWHRGSWLLLILILGFSLSTLTTYPEFHTDEGWQLNRAWTSIHTGPLYSPSINLGVYGDPQPLDAEMIWWTLGLWLKAVGLGLEQGRLFMWLFAPLLIGFLYLAGRTLYDDRKAGLFAALFAATSTLTVHVSHLIRQEIIFATVIALGFYLHALTEKRGRFREAFALGLLIALTFDIHTNAFLYGFAFGVYYLGRAIWHSIHEHRSIFDPRLLGIATGGILGVSLYIALHVLPDIDTFRQQAAYIYSANYGSGVLTLATLQSRFLLILGHLRDWYAFSLVEGSMIALAIGLAFIWRRRIDRSMLTLFGLCLLAWILLGSRRTPTYIAFILPIIALIVGGVLVSLSTRPTRVWITAVLLLAAMTGNTLRAVLTVQQSNYNTNFTVCLDAVRERLPDEGLILGEQLFWLARPTLDDYAVRTLVEAPWPTRTTMEWWAWLDPDIVLWPGVPYGPHFRYVKDNGYYYYELPECTDFLSIWVKSGVELRSPSDNAEMQK